MGRIGKIETHIHCTALNAISFWWFDGMI